MVPCSWSQQNYRRRVMQRTGVHNASSGAENGGRTVLDALVDAPVLVGRASGGQTGVCDRSSGLGGVHATKGQFTVLR